MAEMKTVVVGDILIQDNQERKFGSASQYTVIWVTSEDGTPIPLVFTQQEVEEAIARALKNPEDIPELGSETSINEFDKD